MSKKLEKEDTKKLDTTKHLVVKITRLEEDRSLIFKDGQYRQRRKKHTCYVCMKKFYTYQDLENHRAIHSSSESDEDDNIIEEKVIKTLTRIKKPEPDSDNSETKPSEEKNADIADTTCTEEKKENKNAAIKFKCDTCDVFFNTSDDAKAHPFQKTCKFSCRVCTRTFSTLYAMVIHILQHKTNEEVKNDSGCIYKCELCNKAFSDCFQVHRHQIQFHKIKSKAKKQASVKKDTQQPGDSIQFSIFTCDLCYDEFSSKKEFEAHLEFHEQLKNDTPTPSIRTYSSKKAVGTTLEAKQTTSDTIVIEDDETGAKDNAAEKTPPEAAGPEAETSSQSNKKLTESILKDMMGKSASKSILLPEPVLKNKPNILKKKASHPPIEVKQTGPLSYQIVYKATEASATTETPTKQGKASLIKKPRPSPKNSVTASKTMTQNVTQNVQQAVPQNITYITTPQKQQNIQGTPSGSPVNLGDANNIAYVIIPHQNPGSDQRNVTLTPQMQDAIINVFRNQNNIVPQPGSSIMITSNEVASISQAPMVTSLPVISSVASMASSTPQKLATTIPQTIASNIPQTFGTAIAQTLAGTTIPQTIASNIPQTLGTAIAQTLAGTTIPQTIASNIPQTFGTAIARTLAGTTIPQVISTSVAATSTTVGSSQAVLPTLSNVQWLVNPTISSTSTPGPAINTTPKIAISAMSRPGPSKSTSAKPGSAVDTLLIDAAKNTRAKPGPKPKPGPKILPKPGPSISTSSNAAPKPGPAVSTAPKPGPVISTAPKSYSKSSKLVIRQRILPKGGTITESSETVSTPTASTTAVAASNIQNIPSTTITFSITSASVTNSTPSTSSTVSTTPSTSAEVHETILIESDSDNEENAVDKSTSKAEGSVSFITVKKMEDLIEKKQPNFVCPKCGLNIEKMHDVKAHYLDQHNLYLCHKCGFETKSVTDFGSHRITVHTCTKCFSFCSDLSTHTCSNVK